MRGEGARAALSPPALRDGAFPHGQSASAAGQSGQRPDGQTEKPLIRERNGAIRARNGLAGFGCRSAADPIEGRSTRRSQCPNLPSILGPIIGVIGLERTGRVQLFYPKTRRFVLPLLIPAINYLGCDND